MAVQIQWFLFVGATPSLLSKTSQFQIIAGAFDSSNEVFLEYVVSSEFDQTKRISGTKACVFNVGCNYDTILGQDVLHIIGLTLCFDTKEMKWLDSVVPMKIHDFWQTPMSYFLALDHDDDRKENIKSFAATKILDAIYEKVDINEVVKKSEPP